MNPRVEFTEEAQILEDLRSALPGAAFSPYAEYDVIPVTKHLDNGIHGDRHGYCFVADVKNVGHQRVTDFQMRVFFPRAFLNPHTAWGAEDNSRSPTTHICFVADQKTRAPEGLYPGDSMKHPLTIEYFITQNLCDNPDVMQGEIRIELFSGPMKPKTVNFCIKDLQ